MKFLILFTLSFSLKATAQMLPNFVLPAGYTKVLETKGDLDKDGTDEVILVYNTNKKDGEVGFKRELYICKREDNSLKLWKRNSTVLWASKDCGFCTDSGVNLSVKIKNNTVIIEQTFWHNTRHTSIFRNIFRYQNNDWFLIGSTYNDRYNCGYDYTYDINFSIGQVNINYDSEDCEDDEQHTPATKKSFKYPFKSIPKMDGFTAGKVEIKIPKSDRYFYY